MELHTYLQRAQYHLEIGLKLLSFGCKQEKVTPWSVFNPDVRDTDWQAEGFYIETSDDGSDSWYRKDYPDHPILTGLHVIVSDHWIEVWCDSPEGQQVQIIKRKITNNHLLEIRAFVEVWCIP